MRIQSHSPVRFTEKMINTGNSKLTSCRLHSSRTASKAVQQSVHGGRCCLNKLCLLLNELKSEAWPKARLCCPLNLHLSWHSCLRRLSHHRHHHPTSHCTSHLCCVCFFFFRRIRSWGNRTMSSTARSSASVCLRPKICLRHRPRLSRSRQR